MWRAPLQLLRRRCRRSRRLFHSTLLRDTVVTTWGRHERHPTLVAVMAPFHRWMREGTVTTGLQTAFADPAVRAAHIYEFTAIIIVPILMVIRPF